MGNGEEMPRERAQAPALTDDLLIRYLLGELEKADRLQVAERSFCDDDVFDRLLEAENDLVDRFIEGRLTATEGELFEKALAEREGLRQKVAFAGALRAATSARSYSRKKPSGMDESDKHDPAKHDSANHSDRKKLWYSLAAVASLLLVIGGFWVVRRGQQSSLTAQRQQEGHPNLNGAGPSPGSTELSKDAQTTPSLGNEPTQGSDRTAGAGPEHNPVSSVATFVLLPGSTRSAGQPQILKIRSGIHSVRLQLQLDETEEYPAYIAVLRTLHGDLVLKRAGLRPSRLPFGKAITLDLPAPAPGPGQYEVELSGHPKSGADTVVNYYYFSIAKD